mmetsp:Transcript_15363/g.28935  ORF Transcript_15363/g.28935 Transcript_15363/m.28935 type:complete len:981 (-) Transcript_15363:28-2970(-)
MTHVLLFYKYTPLSSDPSIMAIYQKAMQDLCSTLKLTGRVLLGISDNAEGINGTLAGDDEKNILAYTYAMLGREWCSNNDTNDVLLLTTKNDECLSTVADEATVTRRKAVCDFWVQSREFAENAGIPIVTMDSPSDFKRSFRDDTDKGNSGLFPDLQIRLVKEVIGTGGVLSSIAIQDTSKGYLTPEEWHEEMKKIKDEIMSSNTADLTCSDTVLIDCRNHKEFEIGHFEHALDPNTKTFEQFPRWVRENKSALKGKKILMYCTGGIRCEKASAFVRNELEDDLGTTVVKHLKGGIHKYLERYGANGYWKGKNFVFDRRLGVDANDHVKGQDDCVSTSIKSVGKCLYCAKPHDNFTPDAVSTVCREMTLVCAECKLGLHGEFHCSDHQHLKNCYFTNLSRFDEKDLSSQLHELESIVEKIAVGKRFRSRRRTINKQIDRVAEAIKQLQDGERPKVCNDDIICRSCGDTKCDGSCWGVHGLKRKYLLEKSHRERPARNDIYKRSAKIQRREKDINEIKTLRLSRPCSEFRCAETSLRCPPPFVRQLKSLVKGKCVGKSVQSVLQSEFHELGDTERLQLLFEHSLIRVNGIPVNSEAALFKGVDANRALSQDVLLKNMDVISRITHWHDPPVIVPAMIEVRKMKIPVEVLNDNIGSCDDILESNEAFLFCCNKPATVPVHPAGPYLQNSLTLMVEAQEGLEPRSLFPCHRLDRCTSGLTLCCTSPAVARLVQVQMDSKLVDKMYLARVQGKFPTNQEDMERIQKEFLNSVTWSMSGKNVNIEAPIAIENVMKGLRIVNEHGKNAKSMFRCLDYDDNSDTSLIYASPITGRQHQLRVHLRAIGFPIHNDLLYGGKTVCGEVEKMKSNALDALALSSRKDFSSENVLDGITEDSIDAAKKVCLVCQGKPEEAFSVSQLLCGGHSIDLHAVACRIKFKSKRGRDISSTDQTDIVGTLDCRLDQYPDWVKIFDCGCLDQIFLSGVS